MDEKLAALAKCTVLAGCSRRELTELGRLAEVAMLSAGATLPMGGRGRWCFLVLGGRGLVVTAGTAQRIVGEGDRWAWRRPKSETSVLSGRERGGDRVVALTELTVAILESRAAAVLERWCPPESPVRDMDASLPIQVEHAWSRSVCYDMNLVGSRSRG